jgi:hypothetical protein
MRRRFLLTWIAVVAAVATVGCGGSSPSSPSAGGAGVEVQGVVLGEASGVVASSGAHASSAPAQKIVVTVQGTTITAEVEANGTFVLKGIPSGNFTLVFTVNGEVIGTIEVTAPDGAEVKVTVQVKNKALVVIEVKIETLQPGASPSPSTCAISGGKQGQGIELEGTKATGPWDDFTMQVNGERGRALVAVKSSAGTSIRCIGGAKTDSVEACKALLTQGTPKVHVRGTLTACDPTSATVTATEVKVQKD